jgi:hypothetical protein
MGKTANVQGSLAQPTDESNCSANFVVEEFWETSGPQNSDKNDESKQNHENNEFYLSCVRAIRARMFCAFAASVCRVFVDPLRSLYLGYSEDWDKGQSLLHNAWRDEDTYKVRRD